MRCCATVSGAHYEFTGEHFAKTTGYEYYADVAAKLKVEGADGL